VIEGAATVTSKYYMFKMSALYAAPLGSIAEKFFEMGIALPCTDKKIIFYLFSMQIL